MTSALRDVLMRAASLPDGGGKGEISRAELERAAHADAPVPWRWVLAAVRDLRDHAGEGGADGGPWLHDVCRGARLRYPSPPRRPRNPALEERLQKLRARQEEEAYRSMVQDVDATSTAGESGGVAPYKEQIGFGLNVVVLMGVGFALGFVALGGLAGEGDPGIAPLVGGLVGATCAMTVETVLCVVECVRAHERARTSVPHANARTDTSSTLSHARLPDSSFGARRRMRSVGTEGLATQRARACGGSRAAARRPKSRYRNRIPNAGSGVIVRFRLGSPTARRAHLRRQEVPDTLPGVAPSHHRPRRRPHRRPHRRRGDPQRLRGRSRSPVWCDTAP